MKYFLSFTREACEMQIFENISRSWLAMFSNFRLVRIVPIVSEKWLEMNFRQYWDAPCFVEKISLDEIYGKVHLALWYSLGPGEMFPPSVGCTFENSWDASCFVPLASWCKISLDEISRWSFEQMNCQNASCFLHLALWCRGYFPQGLRLMQNIRLFVFPLHL